MPCSRQLLTNLIKIEMNNLKNICPFVYEIKSKRNTIVRTENNKTLNIRSTDTRFIPFNHHNNNFTYCCSINVNTSDNTSVNPNNLCLSKVYFINGYNEYISLYSHIQSKYNVKCDEICDGKR